MGGDPDTELWCFNEEQVVQPIADTTTPVLAGTGREDDQILAEEIADARDKNFPLPPSSRRPA